MSRVVRGGRHPARRLALQSLFEVDFTRGDPQEACTRGAFRAGLTDDASAFAWSLVSGVLELGIHHISVAQKVFEIGALSAADCVFTLLVALVPVTIIELAKLAKRRRPALAAR